MPENRYKHRYKTLIQIQNTNTDTDTNTNTIKNTNIMAQIGEHTDQAQPTIQDARKQIQNTDTNTEHKH